MNNLSFSLVNYLDSELYAPLHKQEGNVMKLVMGLLLLMLISL